MDTDDEDFTAGEREGDCSVEEPHSVDLPSQQGVGLVSTRVGTECGWGQPDIGESRLTDILQTPISDSGDLKNLFAGMLAAINESNKALQSSVEAKINRLQENSNRLQASVESKLSNLQETVRADIRSESEKLIKKFEKENQKLSKQFSDKLDSESKKLLQLVGQVQKDTETELVAVKKQIQALSNDLEDKLEQTNIQANARVDQLTSKVIENKSDADNNLLRLDQRLNKLDNDVRLVREAFDENASVFQRRQRESTELINQRLNTEISLTDSRIEKLSSDIVALRSKVSEWDGVTRPADSAYANLVTQFNSLPQQCVLELVITIRKLAERTPCALVSLVIVVCV
jgi:hypothetical protein